MKSRVFKLLIVCMALVLPTVSHACAVCYGAPNSSETHGMNLAIFAMLTVTYAILGGAIAFFYGFWKRSRQIAAQQKGAVS